MRERFYCVARLLTVALIILLLFACGHGQRAAFSPQPGKVNEPAASITAAEVTWPDALPVDVLQPWETLDGSGRIASSINLDSEFVAGVERFSKAGEVSDLGEASSFASGASGAGDVSYALYRIPLGSEQPGTIAADVNLHAGGAYYLGVADYSANTWRWHGPFAAPHVRIALPHYEYTSALGNLFIAVVAYDGAAFDLVGLGVNARDEADNEAPSIPEAPILTPVAGGLHVRWLPVDAEDLAGYRVYAGGEEALGYVEGGESLVIPASAETEITLMAIDLSGNESEASEASVETPLVGDIPAIELTASAASGGRHAVIELTAIGAETYDWDVDGDGDWDITGDATGTATASTASYGLMRPALQGHTAGGGFSLSAVSLLIAGNSRPVAEAFANPSYGQAPLEVNFEGFAEDDDGTIALYAWDFDGDGTYDYSHSTNPNPPPQTYSATGLYNAKFRVTDNEGAWDVDTVAVQVTNLPPVAILVADKPVIYLGETGSEIVTFYATDSYDPDNTAPLRFSFDPCGDNNWASNGNYPIYHFDYRVSGSFNARVTVQEEPGGLFDMASVQMRVYRFGSMPVNSSGDVGEYTSLAVVNGNPAVSFWDLGNCSLNYVRASDASGCAWRNPVTVDSAGDVGSSTSLAVVNGNPAISYYDQDNEDLKYACANDANGISWNRQTVDSTGSVGYSTSLYVVNGHPAISYRDNTNKDLKYVRATEANGYYWGLPEIVDSAGDVGEFTSLCVVNGNPAISYYDNTNGDLKYARATDADGTAWQTYTVDSTGTVGRYTSLCVVNGNPAISYYDDTNNDLKYARATDADGTTWETCTVDAGSAGRHNSLYAVNGKPAISYHDSLKRDLKYAYATDAGGTSWYAYTVDSAGDVGEYTSLYVVNGHPAISYYDGTNYDLRFAYPRLD